MFRVLVVHGPNLNMLGVREPARYGVLTLSELDDRIIEIGKKEGAKIETFQSNLEGELINKIQSSHGTFDGMVINPAGLTHTSVVIRDAILAVGIPTIEVHLSNIYSREDFRKISLLSDIVVGQITGLGHHSYFLGVIGILAHLKTQASVTTKDKK